MKTIPWELHWAAYKEWTKKNAEAGNENSKIVLEKMEEYEWEWFKRGRPPKSVEMRTDGEVEG